MDHSSPPPYVIVLRDLFLAITFVTLFLVLIDPFTQHFAQHFVSFAWLSGLSILLGFVLLCVSPSGAKGMMQKDSLWSVPLSILASVLAVVLTGWWLRDFGVTGWVAAGLTGLLCWSILSADIRDNASDD